MSMAKQRIAAAFSAAAPAYDAAAALQRRVADELADLVCAAPLAGPALEIGCGTGLLTRHLLHRLPDCDWTITDLSPAMVARCAETWPGLAAFRAMDGEAPDAVPGGWRLIASSLAFQWFEGLPAALARLADRLAPGGRLAFATLGAGTFAEWRRAHAELGLACGVRAFPTAAELQAMWPAGGLGKVSEARIDIRHADGRDFARGLKALGAHVPAPGHRPLDPGSFRRVLRRFDGGCVATYHVLYGSFTKDQR